MQFANVFSALRSMFASTGGRAFEWSTSAPSNGVSGFAAGATWVHSIAAGSSKEYINEGTVASASWVVKGTQS